MKVMTIYIGDWSNDGHGMYEKLRILVPEEFTKEELLKNYKRNKGLFGFSLRDFGQEYEDSTLPWKYLKVLRSKGFDPEDLYEEGDDYDLGVDEMLEIAMIFFGHGLPDFHWEREEENPDEVLIGMWNSEAESMIGYGLFF